jgi:hypothetical protein
MKFVKRAIFIGLISFLLSITIVIQASAVPISVIDDFEDGDLSDWAFFGGNAAGGGGGVLADHPKEGLFYMSTGWGGDGTTSGFYGGAFRNLEDIAQVLLPSDPWFNVWIFNQSDATVDQYNLEITLREDLNGDGWTNGLEDSFRFDSTFLSSSFDDQWTLISAPISSFINSFTGGNGIFDGALDEIVIVFSGVVGGTGSTIQADFDQFAFSSGGPISSPPPIGVPVPTSFALFVIGLAGLRFLVRKKV